jgi:hypothetical protein
VVVLVLVLVLALVRVRAGAGAGAVCTGASAAVLEHREAKQAQLVWVGREAVGVLLRFRPMWHAWGIVLSLVPV